MRPNFNECERIATELLINSDVHEFPIDVRILNYKQNIKIDTMQNYCKLTNIHISELLRNKNYKDAFVIKMQEISIILYNEDVFSDKRQYWNLGHELGHVLLDHNSDEEKEEVEAHFLCAQLFMPDPVIVELIKRHVNINKNFLTGVFGVSEKAAIKKINTLRKNQWKLEESYQFEFNDVILGKFIGFIERLAPQVKDIPEENDLYNGWGNKQSDNPFMRRYRND